jgi:hypothetical protein
MVNGTPLEVPLEVVITMFPVLALPPSWKLTFESLQIL